MLKRIKKRCNPHHKKNKTEISIDNKNRDKDKNYDYNSNIVDTCADKCDNDITASQNEQNNGIIGAQIEQNSDIPETEHVQNNDITGSEHEENNDINGGENEQNTPTTSQHRTSRIFVPTSTSTETVTSPITKTRSSSLPKLDNDSIQSQKKNKKISFLGNRLFKKRKDSVKNSPIHDKLRKASAPDIGRIKSFSKSVSDLLDRRHSTPGCIQGSSNKRSKDISETSSRSSRGSAASLETIRENRRSAIAKLDEYIKHLKKSIDEENIANAPKRLCCAQLLRTVYLRRERECHYESLQNSNKNNINNKKRRSTRHSSVALNANNSDPDFQTRSSQSVSRTNSRSLQDFGNSSFDLEPSDTKVAWHPDTLPESENSSMCSKGYSTDEKDSDGFSNVHYSDDKKVEDRARNCDSGCSSDSDDEEEEDMDNNNTWNADVDGLSFDNCNDKFFGGSDSKKSDLKCREMLGARYRRKSMPLFPQALDIDIY